MTLKVTQGRRKFRYSIDPISLPSGLHVVTTKLSGIQFPSTTFTVYMTGFGLEKREARVAKLCM